MRTVPFWVCFECYLCTEVEHLPVYWMEMFVCMEMEMLRPDNDFARASIKKAKTKVFLRLKCYSTSRLGKQNKISPVEILPRVKQDSHSQSWIFRIWQGGCSLQSIAVFNILYLAKTGAEWSLQPPWKVIKFQLRIASSRTTEYCKLRICTSSKEDG